MWKKIIYNILYYIHIKKPYYATIWFLPKNAKLFKNPRISPIAIKYPIIYSYVKKSAIKETQKITLTCQMLTQYAQYAFSQKMQKNSINASNCNKLPQIMLID